MQKELAGGMSGGISQGILQQRPETVGFPASTFRILRLPRQATDFDLELSGWCRPPGPRTHLALIDVIMENAAPAVEQIPTRVAEMFASGI